MPAAALHHAGIHSRQLEEQEQLLKDDVVADAARWGGKILLHRELPPEVALRASSSRRSINLGSSPARDDVTALADTNPLAAVQPFWEPVADCSGYPSSSTPGVELRAAAGRTMSDGQAFGAGGFGSWSNLGALGGGGGGGAAASSGSAAADSMNNAAAAAQAADSAGSAPLPVPQPAASTAASPFAAPAANGAAAAAGAAVELPAGAPPPGPLNPSTPVPMAIDGRGGSAAAGSPAGLSPHVGKSLATAREVFGALRAQGLQLSYRRIPLSRERTPESGDVQDLYRQMVAMPADPNRCLRACARARAALPVLRMVWAPCRPARPPLRHASP
jgi:hypothetical protein